MINKSISNKDAFKISDESTGTSYFGCKQDWYSTEWQRISGCGPTTAANIINYLIHLKAIQKCNKAVNSKERCQYLMDETWKYVTPTDEGIKTAELFYQSFISYASSKGIAVEGEFINVPSANPVSCSLSEILSFIERALNKDVPVAFLNLSNGDEKSLEEWHWVTIISLQYDKDSAYVQIVDEGMIKKIDLSLWHKTTTLGGGLAYFYLNDNY